MSASFSLLVKQAVEDVYEVFDWCTVAVCPSLWSCTYGAWNVTRFPCKYACAIIRFMQWSILNYVDYHMMVETFKVTYAPTLYPIRDYDKPKVRFCPPCLKSVSTFSHILSTITVLCPSEGRLCLPNYFVNLPCIIFT